MSFVFVMQIYKSINKIKLHLSTGLLNHWQECVRAHFPMSSPIDLILITSFQKSVKMCILNWFWSIECISSISSTYDFGISGRVRLWNGWGDVVEGDESEGGEWGHKPGRDVIFACKTWLVRPTSLFGIRMILSSLFQVGRERFLFLAVTLATTQL